MASREELRRLGAALNQRHTPEQMLDIWLPIVADRTRKGDAAKATTDAERVLADERAADVAKKKAAAVVGLAKRDLGDVEAARALLNVAVGGPGPKAAWQTPVAQALKELTDPTVYYLPRARELYEDGKYQEAMVSIAEARKVFPKHAGDFQALSGQIQLDIARAKGKLDPASPAVIEAKRDAEAAAAAGSAEGHYALGRIHEELGNLADAKAAYAKALAAHGDNDAAGARYRVALARVLKLQADKAAGGRAAAAALSLPVADLKRQPLLTLVLLVELGLQPGGGPEQDEATRLLKEVESVKDGPDTFMLKAQALALRGLWTPALKAYAAGLRPHVRRDYADGLAELIERHPALRRPAGMEPPNPLLAEINYAAGLRNYFARHYDDAEASFVKAIEYDNQDARYFYFLGLSRLGLGRTNDAEADFQEGAQLEVLNRPGREAVSTALERVQGPARQAVNRARP
jgi:tetratricopeptide (TPR) repeat protein